MDNFTLGNALFMEGLKFFQQNDLASAEGKFSQALECIPDNSAILTNLSVALAGQKKFAEARQICKKAIGLNSSSAKDWLNYGYIATTESMHAEAIEYFDKALQLDPDYVDAWLNKATSLDVLKRGDEARGCYEEALKRNPDYLLAWINFGNHLLGRQRYEESLNCFAKAISLNPQSAPAWFHQGVINQYLKRYEAALASYQQALNLNPRYAEAWSNCGITLQDLKRYQEALDCYDRALEINPTLAEPHWNGSLAHLVRGEFKTGWEKYEYRWKKSDHKVYRHAQIPPLRSLENLQGKSVLIWAEQGLGDSLQFCRYLPLLHQLGARVVFEVQAPLEQLTRSLTGCEVILADQPTGHIDYQLPLLSLPRIFQTDLATIPAAIPYLHANRDKINEWQRYLAMPQDRLSIGIACSSLVRSTVDFNRFLSLAMFEPLLARANLVLIQKEVHAADQGFLQAHPQIKFIGGQLRDFDDSAAVIENMDLIISIDTSLAHLAGALGKPLYVLLPWAPEWRWLLDRDDSPWYPSAKIFRQKTLGDWQGLIAEVVNELEGLSIKLLKDHFRSGIIA